MTNAERFIPQGLSEDEIAKAIKLHGEGAWDLIQAGVIDPATLETKPQAVEPDPRRSRLIEVGSLPVHQTTDYHEHIAV